MNKLLLISAVLLSCGLASANTTGKKPICEQAAKNAVAAFANANIESYDPQQNSEKSFTAVTADSLTTSFNSNLSGLISSHKGGGSYTYRESFNVFQTKTYLATVSVKSYLNQYDNKTACVIVKIENLEIDISLRQK